MGIAVGFRVIDTKDMFATARLADSALLDKPYLLRHYNSPFVVVVIIGVIIIHYFWVFNGIILGFEENAQDMQDSSSRL